MPEQDSQSAPSAQDAIVRAGGWILTLAVIALWIGTGHLWRNLAPGQPISEAKYAVDINHATEKDLLNLPEVGPSLARNILSYREQHGDFHSLSDFGEVPGVGPQTLKQLAPFLYFAKQPGAASESPEDTTEETLLTAQSRERITP